MGQLYFVLSLIIIDQHGTAAISSSALEREATFPYQQSLITGTVYDGGLERRLSANSSLPTPEFTDSISSIISSVNNKSNDDDNSNDSNISNITNGINNIIKRNNDSDDALVATLNAPQQPNNDKIEIMLPSNTTLNCNITHDSRSGVSSKNSTNEKPEVDEFGNSTLSHHPPLLSHCRLYPTDPHVHAYVTELVADQQTKLIEYRISFNVGANVTGNASVIDCAGSFLEECRHDDAGLVEEKRSSWNYKRRVWSRVTGGYGQTMISLAFNYQILSLMTLSFGVETVDVQLMDEPAGCLNNLTNDEQLMAILDITMRDLKSDNHIVVVEGQSSVCHQVIEKVNNEAIFTYRCCSRLLDTNDIRCKVVFPNKWLNMLDVMLCCFTTAVFVFGVLFVPGWMYSSALDSVNYVVKLKEPMFKTMSVCFGQDLVKSGIVARHILDLRNTEDFNLCRRVVAVIPPAKVIPIRIDQYDIKVNYRKLLMENYVPVSLIESITKALFLCKLRELDAFKDCCDSSVSGSCIITKQHRPWISFCEVLGRFMMVVFLPFPFYIRLVLYYLFEHEEICDRQEVAARLGLAVSYNYRLLQFLTPSHPILLTAYALYFIIGFKIAYFDKIETRFQAAIVDSFADLKQTSWLAGSRMFVRNILYPFRNYGIFGLVAGLFLWPIIIPLSAAVYFFYCFPIVFLTYRVAHHILTTSSADKKKMIFGETMESFEAENVVRSFRRHRRRRKISIANACSSFYYTKKKSCLNILATTVALLTIYSVLLIAMEVTGYMAEIICFTMMGLIVNATRVIKYGSLVFLVVIYCYDTYKNVNKKYEKLNKALFSEIKSRIKGLNELTSLPSYLQKNTGFKASEASEQAEHETPDDFSRRSHQWDINDLILFVDNEDTPRIPKMIFDESCLIQVSGSPGPIYRSLLQASGQFAIIIVFLVFVFIVVMSFGDAYKVSSTNQMLATLAGGFMPFILSNMLKPMSSEVETNLVSYKSKLEEIIENFHQSWPMYDIVFNIDETHTSKNRVVRSLDSDAPPGKPNNRCCKDLANPLIDILDIQNVLDSMSFESVEGQTVDLAVLVSEQFQKWNFDLTSSSESDSDDNYLPKIGLATAVSPEIMQNVKPAGEIFIDVQTDSV